MGIVQLKKNLRHVNKAMKNGLPIRGVCAHLSYFGSVVGVGYKGVSHAEGGGLILSRPSAAAVASAGRGNERPASLDLHPCSPDASDHGAASALLYRDPLWVVRGWEMTSCPLPREPRPEHLAACRIP